MKKAKVFELTSTAYELSAERYSATALKYVRHAERPIVRVYTRPGAVKREISMYVRYQKERPVQLTCMLVIARCEKRRKLLSNDYTGLVEEMQAFQVAFPTTRMELLRRQIFSRVWA